MVDDAAGPAPFAEFLDDYFVECDEHLSVARRGLLALEPSVGQPAPNRPLLDELFRSFHSIKGLSAMVGVREAEGLAHQLESYLSALRKGQLRLSSAGLDALIAGIKLLEQVIAARRQQLPAPDTAPVLAQVAAQLADSGPATAPTPTATSGTIALPPEQRAALDAALREGARAWHVMFQPSPALAERGVNVNSVRQRLQEIGRLLHAVPLTAGGRITFAFILTSQADDSTLDAWRDDGVTFTPYETAPPAAPGPARPKPSLSLAPSNLVRVDLDRLDELMGRVGELVMSRARLEGSLDRLRSLVPAAEWRLLQETNQAMERQLRDLREGVMRVRLVPVREVFARLQFVVRDLARETGKNVVLRLGGEETEIDKLVVERMADPLLHLVRNAVSHGLETPAERAAAGKLPEGRLDVRAKATGETIQIEVEDDGRGIDAATVFARARAAGIVPPDAPADPAGLLDVLCAPGFSTRDQADRASGRGVGMDVVRSAVEDLGGTLTLQTRPGRGTRFVIQLPLTLAIADALIVVLGGQTYAVPQVAVREVMQVRPDEVTALENNEIIGWHGAVLPILRPARFFGAADRDGEAFYALVVGDGTNAAGLAVERVLGLREIVVRPLTDPLVKVPGVSGSTELGDGRVVLILDTVSLTRAVRRATRARGFMKVPQAPG